MTTQARLGRLAVVTALAVGSTIAISGHAHAENDGTKYVPPERRERQ
ncbi:hypothetical protein ACIF6H_36450 [Streptomyces microflavus]|nr:MULTISPECIES: hypothetical protein [unclassified Streptomyces]